MAERRFDEEEVARILARASETRDEAADVDAATGLTLTELQEIAKEAGIDPSRVAVAAREVDRPLPAPVPTVLGMQVGVADSVQLDRRISNDEWERLVVLLRETFAARGHIQVFGNLRQWTNGNLQVLVEPGASGDRVRLKTRNAGAQAMISLGAAVGVGATALFAFGIGTGGMTPINALTGVAPILVIGATAFLTGLARLRRWAPTREEQMREIVARLEAGTV